MRQAAVKDALELGESLLVRIGLHGQVGRFSAPALGPFTRSDRVICRTARGLEVGEVLGQSPSSVSGTNSADGRVVRKMLPEDELLWKHLRELGSAACSACEDWLQKNESRSVLLDVEPLFDGRTLYFHFLSGVDEQVQAQLDKLVEIYEERVQQSKFAQLVEHGCGPGCGTANATRGCDSKGGCAVCQVARACQK